MHLINPVFAMIRHRCMFLHCALVLAVCQSRAAEGTLTAEIQAPVFIQGRQAGMMKLPAGSKLAVLSTVGDSVIVRRPGLDPFKLPRTAILLETPVPPTPAPTPQPTPTPTTAPPPPSAPLVPLNPGWNTVQFPKLPAPPEKPKWFRYDFEPAAEKFLIYLPKDHDPAKPCGVLGWTNPGDQLVIPKKFEPLFDEFNLIAISAERCGNKQDSDRRAGLLVSGILALSECVRIDRERIVLSGFSGGGRLSALGCFVHPEFFRGAVSWCGGNFYKDYPNLKKENYVQYGIPRAHNIPDAVTAKNVSEARRKIRFVLITGEKDSNYDDSHFIEAAMKEDRFQVQLIDEPGLGHAVGSPESMRRGLEYVLGKPQ